MVKDPDLPDVPLLRELAKNPADQAGARIHVEGDGGRPADRDHAGRAGGPRRGAAPRLRR